MSSIAKRLILNILVVTYLTCNPFNVECAQHSYTKFLQENAPSMKYLAEFVNAANNQQALHHKLVRRQTTDESAPTPEDVAFCSAQLNDISCSTGIVQGFIDAELSCNRGRGIEEAQRDANACARNEGGQYCSSALAQFELGGIRRNDIKGNCSGVLSTNSCPLACCTLLEDFSRRLGCCINAYINDSMDSSNYIYNSYRAVVDYRLWNSCNVRLPADGCDNGPTVNRPVNVRECTDEDFFNKQFTQNFCLPERGQPYINVIVLNSRCNQSYFSSTEYLMDFCSIDANGSPCGLTESDYNLIDDINSDCANSDVSCTLNCSDSISDAKNAYGCCLNSVWFNTSTSAPPALSYSVWKSCKIEMPGFCDSPLSLRGTAASIMKGNHLAILIMTIVGLMCHYMQDYI